MWVLKLKWLVLRIVNSGEDARDGVKTSSIMAVEVSDEHSWVVPKYQCIVHPQYSTRCRIALNKHLLFNGKHWEMAWPFRTTGCQLKKCWHSMHCACCFRKRPVTAIVGMLHSKSTHNSTYMYALVWRYCLALQLQNKLLTNEIDFGSVVWPVAARGHEKVILFQRAFPNSSPKLHRFHLNNSGWILL